MEMSVHANRRSAEGGEQGNDPVKHKVTPVSGAGSRGQPAVGGAAVLAGGRLGGPCGRRCHKMAVLCAAPLGPAGSGCGVQRPPCAGRAAIGWRAARAPGSGAASALPPPASAALPGVGSAPAFNGVSF